MIKLENINKTYNNGSPLHVLKGIDLEVEQGELVSIMGASGSGKSTLLNILGILDDYDSGSYYLAGRLIKGLSETQAAAARNNMIGYIFQSFNLISYKNAVENVALPLYYQGVARRKRNALALEYLDMLGLRDWAEHMPNEMSGGQKQRVAIAGVIAMRPDCLVLDEATAMLDPIGREKVMRTVHRLNDDYGITVVQITHYMEEAATADRVVVMSAGRVVMEGTPKEVFRNVEELRALHLDVPQAAELCHALTAAGCPMADDIIDVEECAAALYELLTGKKAPGAAQEKAEEVSACPQS